MKTQINFWLCLFISLLQSCNESSALLSNEEDIFLTKKENAEVPDNDIVDEITPIKLNVTLRNGALVFQSPEDLRYAKDVLSNVNLASRLAWEESIGFKSLRGVYEKILQDFFDESSFNLESAVHHYGTIIDFNTPMPTLKNHDLLLSSILNLDHIIYVGEAVGTLNKDGSFWVMDGNIDKLNEILQNPEAETDPETGVVIVRTGQNNTIRITPRSCTISPSDIYCYTETINSGTARGSTQLIAQFCFYPIVIPINTTLIDYTVDVYMNGRSFRRKTCRCGWKPYPDNHRFYWNIEIGKGFSGTIITYSGQDVHFNNQLAVKIIFNHNGIYSTGASFNENFYYLEKIKFDTRHTTDNLDLFGISYHCM